MSDVIVCRANAIAEISEVNRLQSLPFLRALILAGRSLIKHVSDHFQQCCLDSFASQITKHLGMRLLMCLQA